MPAAQVDAVVIGSGPNGLVAANMLADAGWDVVVLEGSAEPGGAVRSAELVEPGFLHDVCSSFYPLAAASPVMQALELEGHGLRWCRAPLALAHPGVDGRCAVIGADAEQMRVSVDSFAAGDGEAWLALLERWRRLEPLLLGALTSPFPPLLAGMRLARVLGPLGLARLLRFGLLPVQRAAEESFEGDGAPRLLAGNAMHADLAPQTPGSALYGWVLSGLAATVGFPVAQGGAGQLTRALVRRLLAAGGELRCESPVGHLQVAGGRVRCAITEGGEQWRVRLAVLADVGAPALYRRLLEPSAVPSRTRADIARFHYDHSTFKVDWTLDGPIPWACEAARDAGTVHVAGGTAEMMRAGSQLEAGLVPDKPMLVMGQYARSDPTRQPQGCETAWAYTHVPQQISGDAGAEQLSGRWDEHETSAFAARVERQIEELAPGFGALIRGRHVLTPPMLERENPNLVGGAINGGTARLHQQLVLRPTPGLGRAETPVGGLYLASASAHPGGGVHGACGSNAARAALAHSPARWLTRRLLSYAPAVERFSSAPPCSRSSRGRGSPW